jgi:hypothetical protein
LVFSRLTASADSGVDCGARHAGCPLFFEHAS